MGKKSAFSLVELMVAGGIVGILVMMSLPRYHDFMVKSRRGEAKSNLSHLASLQSVYKIDHFSYYNGQAMIGNNGIGYKEGRPRSKPGKCNLPGDDRDEGLGNHLGFRPEACNELRYFYQFSGGDAIASAASDYDHYYIYPDCRGRGNSECGYTSGDVLKQPIAGGKAVVCRNITKYCPHDVATVTPVCPPGTCPPGEVSAPYPICCRPCGNCTASWIPSPPVWSPATSTRCSRDSFQQTATVTQNWSPPLSCPSLPCPSSSTRVLSQAARGDVDPICIGANPNPECPCISGDTRPCCSGGGGCTSSESGCSSPSDWTLDDPSFVPANEWECDNSTKRCTLTITYTPPPPTCPSPSSTTRVANVFGQKSVTCDNLCGAWTATSWGSCQQHISGDCQQAGSATRTCNPNPCLDTEVFCNIEKKEVQPCTCLASTCISGDTALTGMTLEDAAVKCDETDTNDALNSYVFESTLDGSYFKFKCHCRQVSSDCPERPAWCMGDKYIWSGPPACACDCDPAAKTLCNANPNREWLTTPQCGCQCDADKKNACNKVGGKWVGYPDCKCAEIDGTTKLKLCNSTLIHAASTLAGIVENVNLNAYKWSNLKDYLNNGWDTSGHNRTWGEVFAELRCGDGGAVKNPDNASMEQFNQILRNHTVPTTGMFSVDVNGTTYNGCSNSIEVTYTCS